MTFEPLHINSNRLWLELSLFVVLQVSSETESRPNSEADYPLSTLAEAII
ncbi:MAG: hypothetical protein AB8B82_17795 [Roseovarius sp.]